MLLRGGGSPLTGNRTNFNKPAVSHSVEIKNVLTRKKTNNEMKNTNNRVIDRTGRKSPPSGQIQYASSYLDVYFNNAYGICVVSSAGSADEKPSGVEDF